MRRFCSGACNGPEDFAYRTLWPAHDEGRHRVVRKSASTWLAVMPARAQVPQKFLARLRLVCLDLPETVEKAAWTGTRWTVGKKNFAHVLMIDQGWPPAYARAAKTSGPACVLTFRLTAPASAAERFSRRPFFRPLWWPNIAGLILGSETDWDEVDELIVKSYRVLAGKKLAALVGDAAE